MRAESRLCRIVIAFALAALAPIVARPAFAKPLSLCVNVGGTGGCFASLHDAVNAAGKSGATINVAFGTYFDNIVVPKTKLTINADPDTALFGNTLDPIMTVAAGAKVTINNLEFQDTFTNSSCIESSGTLTLQNLAVFLCAGKRGARDSSDRRQAHDRQQRYQRQPGVGERWMSRDGGRPAEPSGCRFFILRAAATAAPSGCRRRRLKSRVHQRRTTEPSLKS